VYPGVSSVPVRAVVKACVGVLLALAVVVHLGTGAVLDGLRGISPDAAGLAVGLGVLTTVAAAARWRVVARGLGLDLDLGRAVADCFRAQFLNSVLPAGVLGDVHRAVDAGRRSGEPTRSAQAVVLERVAGQLVVVAVGAAVLLLVPGPLRSRLDDLGPPALLAGGVVAVLLGLVVARRRLAALAVVVRHGLLSARTAPAVLGLSLVTMAGHLALLVVAADAVGVSAPPAELAPVLVVSLLSMGLPLNVGGWGPREATTAAAFGLTGLGAGAGLATAVAFGVLALVSTLPGLAVLAVRARRPLGQRLPAHPTEA
jgi:glycosyltransferase 2 family protein